MTTYTKKCTSPAAPEHERYVGPKNGGLPFLGLIARLWFQGIYHLTSNQRLPAFDIASGALCPFQGTIALGGGHGASKVRRPTPLIILGGEAEAGRS